MRLMPAEVLVVKIRVQGIGVQRVEGRLNPKSCFDMSSAMSSVKFKKLRRVNEEFQQRCLQGVKRTRRQTSKRVRFASPVATYIPDDIF